jgi:hypothetical protein
MIFSDPSVKKLLFLYIMCLSLGQALISGWQSRSPACKHALCLLIGELVESAAFQPVNPRHFMRAFPARLLQLISILYHKNPAKEVYEAFRLSSDSL